MTGRKFCTGSNDGGVKLRPTRSPGNQQDRNVVAENLRGTWKRVLDARSALHREHAGALAVGRSADAVGDANAYTFLAANNRSDSDLGAGIDERLAGITNQMFDALFLEDARNGIGDFHLVIPLYSAA